VDAQHIFEKGGSARVELAAREGFMPCRESPNRVLIIDGYRVAFVRGVGWECNCEYWSAERECVHSIRAAALTTLEQVVIANGGSITRH
jgi:hypothetical protein